MTEFITRNYGNKNFEIIIKTDSKEHYKATQDFARGLIDHAKPAPTIEAKPVVHAHWEYDPNGMDWGIGAWRCSKCSCKNDNLPNQNWTSIYQFAGSKYCPHCGAQMDEFAPDTNVGTKEEEENG